MAKKIIKLLLIIFLAVILLLVSLPFLFRGAIMERVKHEVNERVDASVDFGRFSLSLIRSFPDVSLQIRNISVINNAPFAGDTLADIGRLSVTIDLRSLFSSDGYEVKRIALNRPRLLFRVLEDGEANWNIVPATETERPGDAESSAFHLALQQISIRHGAVFYYDDKLATYVDVLGLSGNFSGDLTVDVTTLATRDATIESFSLRWDRFPILNRVKAQLVAEVEMDISNWMFTFHDNELLINELPLTFDGLVGFPDGGGTLMDFGFTAARSDFAAFLSLIPALYTKDFEALESSGTLDLKGRVDGLLKGDLIPSFDLVANVNNGMFRYPGLPASVSDVEMNARIASGGSDADDVTVDVPVLRLNLAGSPVEARFRLRTPVSDPWTDLAFNGSIDLGDVKNYYPLDNGMTLQGIIQSNLEARGHLSALERGAYDDFHATGELTARDVVVETGLLPQRLDVFRADASLSPRYLAVNAFSAAYGDTDLTLTGYLDNVLNAVLEGEMLTGRFDLQSARVNMNQLMADMPDAEPGDDPAELAVIEVPANIDFTLDANIAQLDFGKMNIRNVQGSLRVVDQQVIMDKLDMQMLGGRLALNGSYGTSGELPEVSFGLDFTSFDVKQAFEHFVTFRYLAPIGQYAAGNISGRLSLNTLLSETLAPMPETMSGDGNLRTSNLQLEGSPVMTQLAERSQLNFLKDLSLRDLLLRFAFADGKVETQPFDFQFADVNATVTGSTWFDQRIDYIMELAIPRQHFGSSANQVLDNLVSQASALGLNVSPGDMIRLDVQIGGTATRPEISLALTDVTGGLRDMVRDEADRLIRDAEDRLREEADRARARAEEEARGALDEATGKSREELEARAQQVIAEAENRAESIRAEASRAAETVREEARKQAERLVEEASGQIAIAAARSAGNALIREADRRATQLETEADQRATQLVEEANRQANRIRQEQP